MKNILIMIFFVVSYKVSLAQSTGINTKQPNATLDVVGDPTNTSIYDGVIAPRITGNQLSVKIYTLNQTGAIVYVTSAATVLTGQVINVDSSGYFYFDGTVWIQLKNSNVTANNGLTKTGSNIQLGGTLIKNTEIETAGFTTSFTGTGNIGIGTNSPFSRLSNSASVAASDNDSRGINQSTGINWVTSGPDYGMILNNSDNSGKGSGLLIKTNSNDNTSRPLQVMRGTSDVLTVTGAGRVGIGVALPTSTLDVANGDVRVRTINSNIGTASIDRLVVADINGVLKTIPKQNPLIFGGNLIDVVSSNFVTSAATGSLSATTNLKNITFTVNYSSLVTINYQLSYDVPTSIPTLNDGKIRSISSSLIFTTSATPSVPTGVLFGLASTPFTISDVVGVPGYYYFNASQTLRLDPGTYSLNLNGSVRNAASSSAAFTVRFGDSPADFITITALQVQ